MNSTPALRKSLPETLEEILSKKRILLLTNRDSDNVGDQIIEATAMSLIRAAMKNLGISEDEFEISTRAAGIISRKYMATLDESLLKDARNEISVADLVLFGGAPLFNYKYQNFYKRTIRTLELAEEYGVPVLFSSIGVEPYDSDNAKSQELKAALSLPCVRQITTRDDIASVQQYAEGTKVSVGHVSDPAVFADVVFGDPKSTIAASDSRPKRIGLVVTRAGIFKDNGIDFTGADQRNFWKGVMELLAEKGYDFKLFTTGHFSDEVLLDRFVKSEGIPAAQVSVTVNSPEELTRQLAACDGVIAYRLHASITSFAYEIPSVGLSWNFKVPYFYESVGYPERALPPEQWNPAVVVAALEEAMAGGVVKQTDFLMTVYETLFAGIKDVFAPENPALPYSYDELRNEIPRYPGTTRGQYEGKVRRKFRRTYENYFKHETAAISEKKQRLLAVKRAKVAEERALVAEKRARVAEERAAAAERA